jgi:hypothetical protein
LQENFNYNSWSTVYDSSGTSATRSGRSPGTWGYRVKANNIGGSSEYSGTKTVLVSPAIPGTPSGPTTDYDGSYTVSWSAVTGAVKYELQERLNGGTWSTIHNASGTSISRTGRTAGTWGYQVRAYGVAWSAYSIIKNVVVTVPPIPTPSGPATDTDGTYTISWNCVSEASSYQLEENFNNGSWSVVYNSNGTSTSRTGRSSGTWNYRVRATSSVGSSSYSNTITVLVAPSVPGTPSGPPTDYDGSYTISWNDVTGAVEYELQERLNGGTWSTIHNASGTSISRTGRTAGTWDYRVRAYGVTWSAYSDTKNVVVTVPPIPTPSGPPIDADGSYTISWNAVSEASSYTLQESYNGGTWSTIYTGSSISISCTGRNAGTWNYRVRSHSPVGDSAYSETITVEVLPAIPGVPSAPGMDADGNYEISWGTVSGATSYQLQENFNGGSWSTIYNSSGTTITRSGRNPGTWNYRLRSCNAAGCSAYSNPDTVVMVAPPVPGTPTGPIDTQYDGAYTISWNAVDGANSYQLQERLDGGTWNTIHDGSETSVSRSEKNVGTWDYRVRAYGVVYSEYSAIKSVTVSVPSIPPAPSGPTMDNDGSYTISWNSETGATGYTLQERTNNGSWSQVYIGTDTSKNLTGRIDGVYDYRVNACSAVGCSAYSGATSVEVDIPQANAVYIFEYDANGNMINMNEP